ncbi:MAG: hypothetical protein Q7V02_11215 [Methylophilus sp.]|nr:hypothetical protein [Methylophilus sp.]
MIHDKSDAIRFGSPVAGSNLVNDKDLDTPMPNPLIQPPNSRAKNRKKLGQTRLISNIIIHTPNKLIVSEPHLSLLYHQSSVSIDWRGLSQKVTDKHQRIVW